MGVPSKFVLSTEEFGHDVCYKEQRHLCFLGPSPLFTGSSKDRLLHGVLEMFARKYITVINRCRERVERGGR